MADAALDQSMDHRAATVATRRHFLTRFVIYGLLVVFAAIYLVPLLVVVLNSFRDQQEIARNGLISLPRSFRLEAWGQAWSTYCIGGTCEGMQRNFIQLSENDDPGDNHLDVAGRRDERLRAVKMALQGSACCSPHAARRLHAGQISLMPWAFILGNLELSNSTYGADPDPRRAGHFVHHPVLPQLLRQHPRRPDQGGAHRRRRLPG
jgi:glucose/mannose transport system permease protein